MQVRIPQFKSQAAMLRYMIDRGIVKLPRCKFLLRRRLIPDDSVKALVLDLAHLAKCESCRKFAWDLINLTRIYVTEAVGAEYEEQANRN